ncbi:MAG: hypothetical protein V1778_00910 [bacterium]
MSKEKRHKVSQAKKGFYLTTAVAAAAGLAGAAILALRRRGVDTDAAAKKLRSRVRSAGTILSGESRQAYNDVRQIIIRRIAESEKPLTKALIVSTVKEILSAFKGRSALTKEEFNALAKEFQTDWRALKEEAKRGTNA